MPTDGDRTALGTGTGTGTGPPPGENGAGPDATTAAAPSGSSTSEPLACVNCRSRKLKCCRTKPVCVRCAKIKAECVYPESRRKPAFKRRNVKDLEARLAHVEDMLKDAAKAKASRETSNTSPVMDMDSPVDASPVDISPNADGTSGETSGATSGATGGWRADTTDVFPGFLFDDANASHLGAGTTAALPNQGLDGGCFGTELMGMGMFEPPPPHEVVDELHTIFFQRQHDFIPLVHPARYLQAYHSAPHMRPPMCLQYAIWASAANTHEKYAGYHDAFYRRARQYLEADELRGVGEQFLTIGHAQAWVLTASYEAHFSNFTRAAMSCARAIRLCNMMGLHRLDDPGSDNRMAQTILPAQSWVELEERRRTFWGAFCGDSHASITTGWPSLIDHTLITTHIPCSEEAFVQGRVETTRPLSELFLGPDYSTFAGAVGICHVFNLILSQVHHERADDRPQDVQHGTFWRRHRDIDNLLSNAFMFMPERLRLDGSGGGRGAWPAQTNLNLHAAVICLHMGACDRAEAHDLPPEVGRASRARLLMSALEIVRIAKQAGPAVKGYRSQPLVALSLYCAAIVFIMLIREARDATTATAAAKGQTTAAAAPPSETEAGKRAGLDFIIMLMQSVGREHAVWHAFLRQLAQDLLHHDVPSGVDMPKVYSTRRPVHCSHDIPLLARTSVARHTKIQPPLPGYLPLGKPVGKVAGWALARPFQFVALGKDWDSPSTSAELTASSEDSSIASGGGAAVGLGANGNDDKEASRIHKRRRVNAALDTSPLWSGAASAAAANTKLPHRIGPGDRPTVVTGVTTAGASMPQDNSCTPSSTATTQAETTSSSSSAATPAYASNPGSAPALGSSGGTGANFVLDPADSFLWDVVDVEAFTAQGPPGVGNPDQAPWSFF